MAKYRMGELKKDDVTLTCSKGTVWPPVLAQVYAEDLEEIRYKESMDAYQRVQVWVRICGLQQMDGDKCPSCPHVLRNGEPVAKTRASLPSVRLTRAPLRRPKR